MTLEHQGRLNSDNATWNRSSLLTFYSLCIEPTYRKAFWQLLAPHVIFPVSLFVIISLPPMHGLLLGPCKNPFLTTPCCQPMTQCIPPRTTSCSPWTLISALANSLKSLSILFETRMAGIDKGKALGFRDAFRDTCERLEHIRTPSPS